MRVAGVAIESGKLYLAAAVAGSAGLAAEPIDGGGRRVEPNSGLDVAHRLVDVTHRLEQDFRELAITQVGLTKTRKTSALTYAEATSRLTLVCAVMAASVAVGATFEEVSTTQIGKTVDVPAKNLEDTSYTLFGFDTAPMYWRAGMAKAFATAADTLAQRTSA